MQRESSGHERAGYWLLGTLAAEREAQTAEAKREQRKRARFRHGHLWTQGSQPQELTIGT